VPAGLTHYETTIDLRPENIEAARAVVLDLNMNTRALTATFQHARSVDDARAGWLRGLPAEEQRQPRWREKFFTYTVQPKSGLTTGTTITNQADIVFDDNAPILTPTTLNTLDVDAPGATSMGCPQRRRTAHSTSSGSSGMAKARALRVSTYSSRTMARLRPPAHD
jgi:hypothetical protein